MIFVTLRYPPGSAPMWSLNLWQSAPATARPVLFRVYAKFLKDGDEAANAKISARLEGAKRDWSPVHVSSTDSEIERSNARQSETGRGIGHESAWLRAGDLLKRQVTGP
jgi:hypothetical protein